MRLLCDAIWLMQISTSNKFVLLKLADCADADHIAFPGIAEIAWSTGISARQVQRSLKELHRAGLIRRQFRQNRSSIYTVLPEYIGNVPSNLHRLKAVRRAQKAERLKARFDADNV